MYTNVTMDEEKEFKPTFCKKFVIFILKAVYGVFSVILFTPFVIVIGILSVTYKFIVMLLMKCQYGDKAEFMGSTDAFFCVEKPQSRLNITAAFSGTEMMTLEWLRDDFLKKLYFPAYKKIDSYLVKVLRVPIYKYGYRFWLNTGDMFDPDFHIRPMDKLQDAHVTITEDQVLNYVSSVSNNPFPEDKPYWEILCIPNVIRRSKENIYEDHPKKVTVFIARIHHAYGDGIHLFKNFFFRHADEPFIPKFVAPLKLNTIQSIVMLFAVITYIPYIIKIFFFMRANPIFGPKTSGQKIVSMSEFVDMKIIQGIKRKYNVNVTSILLTSLGSALYEYFSKLPNTKVPKEIATTFALPMDIPLPDDFTLNNVISGCLVNIPTSNLSPQSRLRRMYSILKEEFHSPAPYAVLATITLYNIIPEYLTGMLATRAPGTGLLSSVPGPDKAPSLGGQTIDDIIFWLPHKGNLGVSSSFMSMEGKIRMGLHVDKTLIKTKEEVDSILNAWVQTIYTLASANSADYTGNLITVKSIN